MDIATVRAAVKALVTTCSITDEEANSIIKYVSAPAVYETCAEYNRRVSVCEDGWRPLHAELVSNGDTVLDFSPFMTSIGNPCNS